VWEILEEDDRPLSGVHSIVDIVFEVTNDNRLSGDKGAVGNRFSLSHDGQEEPHDGQDDREPLSFSRSS